MKSKFFLIFISFVFLTSCSFLNNNTQRKPISEGFTPKELYSKAQDKVRSGSIEQGIEDLDKLLQAYPGSKYAIKARLDIAYNLYKMKKYNRAIFELDEFIQKYPNQKSTPYAYYLRGVAAKDKSSSILDKFITESAQRDVQSVKDAYLYFSELIDKYPESEYSKQAKLSLKDLKNTLARHELYVAIYYTKKGSLIGAINRSKYIIENFPNSSSIPDALHLMSRNYNQIGATELANSTKKILDLNFPNYSAQYSLK